MSKDVSHGAHSRRDLLKRSAVAGAVVWTTPIVQAISMDAATAQSPSGGGTLPPQPAGFPSHVDLVVARVGAPNVYFGLQYDEFSTSQWDWHPMGKHGGSGHCLVPFTWVNDRDVVAEFQAGATVVKTADANGVGTYHITLVPGYLLVFGAAKCGQDCPSGVPEAGSPGTWAFSCG